MSSIVKLPNGGQINWDGIPVGSPMEAILKAKCFTRPAGPTMQVPNAPAKPFLTGGQIIDQGTSQQNHDTGYQNIADQLASLALNNQYSKQAIEQSRVKGVAGAQDNAASRGIFNSSIKDGGIYDVTAQAATAQQHLVDTMAAANASATAQRTILDNALQASQTGFNQAAVENASAIDTGYSTVPATPEVVAGVQAAGQPASPASAFAPKPPAAPASPAGPTGTGGKPQQAGTSPQAGVEVSPGILGHHGFYLPGVGWVAQPHNGALGT